MDEYRLSVERFREKLGRLSPARPAAARTLEAWIDGLPVESPAPPSAPSPAPERTAAPDREVTLTIGMATYDDFDGVYFTAQAIRLYHPEITAATEILVVDNNPSGPCAGALKALDAQIPGYRYVPYDRTAGTAVRDLVFREAEGTFVLCLDSHVFLVPGALRKLLDYLERDPETKDLLQGPLLYDDHRTLSTHMDPTWREGMFGTWATDPRGLDIDAEPFEVPMQGLGAFACRKAAWPGFHPAFTGFGGEEGYIHEKFRQRGGRVLCLPFLRWLHRFPRPFGSRYPNRWLDRVRNYVLGFTELGLDVAPVRQHFEAKIGGDAGREVVDIAVAEAANPFVRFDAIYCINLDRDRDRWGQMQRRFAALGIDWFVSRFAALETPESHHIGCALSHRAIVAEARQRGLRNVLVFEDDAIFLDDTLSLLGEVLRELDGLPWSLCYLGGRPWRQERVPLPGRTRVTRPTAMTCTHAVAYSERVYGRLLDAIPATPAGVAGWLERVRGVDQFYALTLADESIATCPSLASQPSILGQEPEELRGRYY